MSQPEGFISKNKPNQVCKLKRSIYGLKQASRSWNIRFDETIKRFGFIKNVDEPCVYKKTSGSAIVFLVLYEDDILLIENDIPMLQSVKVWLLMGKPDHLGRSKVEWPNQHQAPVEAGWPNQRQAPAEVGRPNQRQAPAEAGWPNRRQAPAETR